MAGCYCPKAFSGCGDQPILTVVGGSFATTQSACMRIEMHMLRT